MNPLKKQLIYFLIKNYNEKFRFLKLRKLIKNLIGSERIALKYQNIKLYAGIHSSIENSILFDEYNEKEILNLIKHFASVNYNFIDVGANVGIHTLTASEANNEIQIFSFEPEPNNFNNFMANIALNGFVNIKPFCLGVGDKQEEKKLNINTGWNKGRHSLKMDFGDNSQKINIPIIQLNVFETYFESKKAMIKIDVEGFEKEVLLGAKNILKSINESILIIELLEENNNSETCSTIINLLKEVGFSSFYKVGENKQFDEVLEYKGSSDYIFVKGTDTLNVFKNYIN